MARDPERAAVAFARTLRGVGLKVPVGSTVEFARALGEVGVDRRTSVYWAGRATLVQRPEDFAEYDRAFAAFWDGDSLRVATAHEPPPIRLTIALDDGETPAPEDEPRPPAGPTLTVRYSAREVLRHKDFAAYTHAELAEARRLMADLRLAGALRRSRRPRRSRGPTARPDVRGTVRRALRTGGEPLQRAWLTPGTRPRRLVLLCDVSGSMEPYTRALLRFVHAAVVGRGRVEAFALGTRLTRLTRELSTHDPDAALAASWRRRRGLVGRHATGRRAPGLQRHVGRARPRPRQRRRDPERRLGPRRPGRPRRADGPPRPRRVPRRVGQPAQGVPRLRPARRRHGRGPAVRRRVRRGPLARHAGTTGGGDLAMKEILDDLDRWRAEGKRVAVARVIDVEGSGPRAPGAAMAVNEDGEVAGSVSGGCVEGAVVTEALDILATGDRRLVTFGYSDDDAFAVGLTCGGTIHLFVEPLDW